MTSGSNNPDNSRSRDNNNRDNDDDDDNNPTSNRALARARSWWSRVTDIRGMVGTAGDALGWLLKGGLFIALIVGITYLIAGPDKMKEWLHKLPAPIQAWMSS